MSMLDLRLSRYVPGGTIYKCIFNDLWYDAYVLHGCPVAHAHPIDRGHDLWGLTEAQVIEGHIAALRHEGLLVEEAKGE